MPLLLVSVTAFLHVFFSTLISPYVLRFWPYTERRHQNGNFRYMLLGNGVHSVVVGVLSFIYVVARWYHHHTLKFSWMAVMATEISLTYFVIELLTTVIRFPQSVSEDKADLLHHISSILCLIFTLHYRGLQLVMDMSSIRLLSQLSVPLLILRLLLLDCGNGDSLMYLLSFSAMIFVHIMCRIAVIPWFWMTIPAFIQTTEISVSILGLLCLLFVSLDLLNIYWLKCMLLTYYKYYPKRYSIRIFTG